MATVLETLTAEELRRLALQIDVEQFYAHEARLLDERRFWEWLDLFTDDTRYWAPLRFNRTRREQAKEFTQDGEYAYFDDNKPFLAARLRRLDTGMAWAEDPPSRTRHLVTNVIIEAEAPDALEINALSNFLVYRNRLETEVDLFAGARQDRLRRTEQGLKVAARTIIFDQNVLLSKNLSIFF